RLQNRMARTRTAMPILTTPEAPGTTTSCLNPELERLFHEHSPMLYRTAYGMLGNHADAEDVLQTLFLRLLQRDLPQALSRNPAGRRLGARHGGIRGPCRKSREA